VDRPAPEDEFITAGGRRVGPEETPVAELPLPGTGKTLQHHPNGNEPRIVKANGTEKGVGEVRQQVEGKYGESKDRARQIGDEAVNNAQAYADTDSPEEAEEKKRGMREKIRQMGVSPICPLYSHIFTFGFLE
jgi:hypothetical protein